VQSGAALLPAAECAPRRAARACTLFIKFYFKFRVGLSAVLESSREISRFREQTQRDRSCVSFRADDPQTARTRRRERVSFLRASDPHPDQETRICGNDALCIRYNDYLNKFSKTRKNRRIDRSRARHFPKISLSHSLVILRVFNSETQRSSSIQCNFRV